MIIRVMQAHSQRPVFFNGQMDVSKIVMALVWFLTFMSNLLCQVWFEILSVWLKTHGEVKIMLIIPFSSSSQPWFCALSVGYTFSPSDCVAGVGVGV